MNDLIKITVEIPTPPLRQTRDFYVKSLADLQRVRIEAADNGYRVLRWETVLVDTPAEITAAVLLEKAATATAIGEGSRAEVVVA